MKWYEINAKNSKDAQVYIYDEIGDFGGYSAKMFIDEVKNLKAENIHIHINSPGGSVFAGLAIYALIKGLEARTISHIDGFAASIASVIALAADEVQIASNGMLMIHNPYSWECGTSEDLRKQADVLDLLRGQLVDIYKQKTGLDEDKIIAMMDAETWLDADTAKELGFVDSITGRVDIAASAFQNYQVNNNKLMPKQLTNQGEDMNKFFTMLAVLNEEEAHAKILALQKAATEAVKLRQDTVSAQNAVKELTIDLAIALHKISPAQRELATRMLAQSPELYEQWLASNVVINPPTTDSGLTDGALPAGANTFEDLLKNDKLMADYQANRPEEFKRLYNAYTGGE